MLFRPHTFHVTHTGAMHLLIIFRDERQERKPSVPGEPLEPVGERSTQNDIVIPLCKSVPWGPEAKAPVRATDGRGVTKAVP